MALMRKMTCNLRHPMGLRHPVHTRRANGSLWSSHQVRTTPRERTSGEDIDEHIVAGTFKTILRVYVHQVYVYMRVYISIPANVHIYHGDCMSMHSTHKNIKKDIVKYLFFSRRGTCIPCYTHRYHTQTHLLNTQHTPAYHT